MDRNRADRVLSVQLPADPPELSAESARILLEILVHSREEAAGMSVSTATIPLRDADEEAAR
jgi:hypothetical protein